MYTPPRNQDPTTEILADKLRELKYKRHIRRHKPTRGGPTPSRLKRAFPGAFHPRSYAGGLRERDLHLEREDGKR